MIQAAGKPLPTTGSVYRLNGGQHRLPQQWRPAQRRLNQPAAKRYQANSQECVPGPIRFSDAALAMFGLKPQRQLRASR